MAISIKARRRAALLSAALLATVAAGCMPWSTAERAPFQPSDIRDVDLRQPVGAPVFRASRAADAARMARGLDRARLDQLLAREGGRARRGAELAFFFGSDAGRAYLKTAGPRAVAFGEPAERCPAVGVALSGDTLPAAVEAALDACFAQLARPTAISGDAECGCRVAAAEEALLAPVEAFEFAPSVSAAARFGDGPTADLIADAAAPAEPLSGEVATPAAAAALALLAERFTLRTVRGEIGVLTLAADGQARLQPSPTASLQSAYVGAWVSEGRRRGRFARQIILRPEGAAAGAPLALVIGYEPAERAARGASLFEPPAATAQ